MSFGQRNLDREKPEIDFPEGDAPTELVITDLIEGAGAEVVPGSRVLTHYVGVAFSTGEEFDASWNRGEPLPFQVGVGQVIRGWEIGRASCRERVEMAGGGAAVVNNTVNRRTRLEVNSID